METINKDELFKRYNGDKMSTFYRWLESPNGKQVYGLFKQYAYAWREAGHYKCGASLIVNRIRWEMSVSEKWQGYKIRNEYAPMMARQLVIEDASFINFFSFHGEKSKAKSEVM